MEAEEGESWGEEAVIEIEGLIGGLCLKNGRARCRPCHQGRVTHGVGGNIGSSDIDAANVSAAITVSAGTTGSFDTSGATATADASDVNGTTEAHVIIGATVSPVIATDAGKSTTAAGGGTSVTTVLGVTTATGHTGAIIGVTGSGTIPVAAVTVDNTFATSTAVIADITDTIGITGRVGTSHAGDAAVTVVALVAAGTTVITDGPTVQAKLKLKGDFQRNLPCASGVLLRLLC